MSIAEKLVTIAENEQKVYEAGKLAVISSSEALKGHEEGLYVVLDDISPIEHNVGVRLSSDTLTDFSGVKVTASGKNLFDYEGIMKKYADGDYEMQDAYSVASIPLKPNTQYTVKVNGERISSGNIFIASVKGVNASTNTGIAIAQNQYWTELEKVLTTDETGNLYIGMYPVSADTRPEQFRIAKVQIEEGTIATEYEPYTVYGEYTVNADGTVEGVKSIYPTTVLAPDAEGVFISADYIKDIDKAFNELTTAVALSGGE